MPHFTAGKGGGSAKNRSTFKGPPNILSTWENSENCTECSEVSHLSFDINGVCGFPESFRSTSLSQCQHIRYFSVIFF